MKRSRSVDIPSQAQLEAELNRVKYRSRYHGECSYSI